MYLILDLSKTLFKVISDIILLIYDVDTSLD